MKTRKFLAVALAMLMLLSAVPMMFATVATADEPAPAALPTETFGGNTYETVTIYDKGDPITGTGSWIHLTDAAGSQLAESGKTVTDAAGILIDVKWDDSITSIQLKFKFTDVSGGGTGGYYYGKDGYVSGKMNDENWLKIKSNGWDGTIFIPLHYLDKTANANASKISIALTANATFDNVRLAYGEFKPEPLLDGVPYETVTIYDKGDPIAASGSWQHYTDAVGSELAASGKNPYDAAGVLIDVKWSGGTNQLKFKFTDISDGATGGYYFGDDGYASGYMDSRNWLNIWATEWQGTIFLPVSSISKWNTVDFSKISVALKRGTYDNIRLVFPQTLTGSITLTDDIAYNVYTKLPAGATNDKVTFTMGDKTVEVAGVAQPDGRMKYSFTDILPQQIGETIEFVWSATVGGETVKIAKSGSVLTYVKELLADDTKTDWHDLAKALLHYGAAAQSYRGVTEGLVNDGVAAATPVDRATLTVAYENGNKEVFKTAALRLDNAIALKIGVAAEDGTDVTWDGGSAKVENGYVYISVNAYEMSEAIVLTCGEDTLTISASWYLKNVDTTDNAALEALIQAIADYAAAAEALA